MAMSDNQAGNGRQLFDRDGTRRSDEIVDRKIREVLIAAGVVPASGLRATGEPSELGRLVLAFLRIEHPDIRADVISLLESIGTLQSGARPAPRR